MERSLVLIKPDAIQRGLAGIIISRIERRGIKIVAMKMLQMDKNLAHRHYAIHQDKAFFNDLIKFITSSPIIAAVFEGEKPSEYQIAKVVKMDKRTVKKAIENLKKKGIID